MRRKILLIFPKWTDQTLWGHFRYKFPALGLLTLAGCTPPDFEVELIDENVTPWDGTTDAELVGLSVMTPLAPRAYELADRFRAEGRTVVLGGIHPSCCPEEAQAHADAVVVGEADRLWPRLLEDFTQGRLQPLYRSEEFIDMAEVRPARRDLLAPKGYITPNMIQFSRGCPYDCEYCTVTAFYGRRFRYRPLEAFVEEFHSLHGRFAFIVDDNIVSSRRRAMELFDRLKGGGLWWGSQAPITIGDDPALLRAMAASGCKSIFIGFESLSQDNLAMMGKQFVKANLHAERIRRIQDHGIGILGSFIVGYDHDTEAVFDELHDFILRTRLETFLVSILTPFPGTKLTARLEQEGRILSRDWRRYDMNTAVIQPRGMTPERLQEKYNALNRALYRWPSVLRRSLKLRAHTLIHLPQNIGYREAWTRLERARHEG